MMKKKNKTKKCIMVMVASVGLMVLAYGAENRQAEQELKQGILRGQTESDITEETYIAQLENGEKLEIPVTVYPRELSDEEKKSLLEQAAEEFEQSYLGENASAEEVSEDLHLQSAYADGLVQAFFESDQPQLLWEDGSVLTDSVEKDGETVRLTAVFSCQGQQLEHSCYVRIFPAEQLSQQGKSGQITEAIEQEEASTRQNTRFQLPEKIGEETIVWTKKSDHQPAILAVAGVIAAVYIAQKSTQDERKKQRIREKQLLKEYPSMVMQISLLMGAGMTAVTAWERMVRRYAEVSVETEEKPLYMEEMLITYRELKDGCGTRTAWEHFGIRIGLAPYRKFSSLLIQNMDKGTKDTAFLLDQEAALVLEEQKNSARRLGEEAGTKLLLPMMLMLLVILMIIMIPAMMSFL